MKKPVLLVVDADLDDLRWQRGFLQDALEDGALICRGPVGRKVCPVLSGRDCSLIHRADGILFELDLDDPVARDILARYVETLDVPVRAVATPEQEERYRELLKDVEVVHPPVGPAMLDGFAAEIESSIG